MHELKTRRSIVRRMRAVWWLCQPDTEDVLAGLGALGFVTLVLIICGGF